MVESQHDRLQKKMETVAEELDKNYFRKIQIGMHVCSIECCKKTDYSVQQLHACVQKCEQPLQSAYEFYQTEMKTIQIRLHRCMMQCEDDVKDKMVPNPSNAEEASYNKMFDNCAAKCYDKMMELLPSLSEKLKETLKKQVKS